MDVATEPDWLATAQRHIAEREYRASENGLGLQAPNRAHGLRTYFEPAGIRVHDRRSGKGPELLRLSLSGVGRGAALAPVPAGDEVVAEENRVEIRRPGLVEWYLNSAEGLEQGFTLAERPAGHGPLVLELALAGARASRVGDAIVFESGSRKLRYGGLVVADARQAALSARFEVPGADRLRIVVDDAGAAYPIVIDPLLTETADRILSGVQGNAFLGFSVAGAGDVNGDGFADVIVGALGYDDGQADEGAAFVFHGGASGIAGSNPGSANAALTSDLAGAGFGVSVAGAGDVNGDGYADVIVGSSGFGSGAGAAFVFHGSASGIVGTKPATAAAQLTSSQGGAVLGISVAGAGDVNGDGYGDVIVGAWRYDNGQADEGAAFVFYGGAAGVGTRTQATANVQLEANQANAAFGISVAGAGDVNSDGFADVIVGAQWWEIGAPTSTEGAAFVYHGSPGGLVFDTSIRSNQADAWFGRSVASAGDVDGDGFADVIVGAPFYTVGFADEGAALVFRGGPGGVIGTTPAAAIALLLGDQLNAQLGDRVAGAGDVNGDGHADVIAAAPKYDSPNVDEGAAFVFHGSALGIVGSTPATAAAQLEGNDPNANFGSGVAGAGDVDGDGYADVIVGAYLFNAAATDDGAAFVYHGGASGVGFRNVDTGGDWISSGQADGDLGASVAAAGDVNGDGYADVIVGAPRYDSGQADEGVAFVFHGGPTGIGDTTVAAAASLLQSNRAGSGFGSVAGAGDVDGDGYADVIVGAPNYDNGVGNEGAAFVFLGGAAGVGNGTPATASARLSGEHFVGGFGIAVAGAGDVNGDGYADVLVGESSSSTGAPPGAAFVFHGGASGVGNRTSAAADTRLESSEVFGFFGGSVAGAGDVNGDGYADVIVGAPSYDLGELNEGAAFVFYGSASGIPHANVATAPTRLESNEAGALFGTVAGAGDVNGDGFADVIVGASRHGAGAAEEGAAFVFLGSAFGIPNGNPGTASAVLDADAEIRFGEGVAGAGDLNGDGYADVAVGAPLFDNVQNNEGAVFVFLGGPAGIASGTQAIADGRIEGNQAFGFLGGRVARAGDVNGDGFADLILGAPQYDSIPNADEGAAFVVSGNTSGRVVLARQRRGDGSGTPVQPWGSSHSATAFAAELHGSHPAGSGRVRGEFEACPTGAPFGSGSCTTGTSAGWVDVDAFAPEPLLPRSFSGLTSPVLYRWRARVQYATPTGAIPAKPPHGPWRRPGAQAVEADLRVLPEPGGLASLLVAAAGFAVSARRRLGS